MFALVGRLWFWLTGWQVGHVAPDVPKFVLVASPHTSNWDFPFTLAYSWVCPQHFSWLGKKEMFRFPFGRLLRRIGGVPVDRQASHGLVAQMVAAFSERARFWLAVPPKGTRGKREYWKSGFYAIALGARVPVALGYLDFRTKRAGIGALIELTGDVGADMDRIRAFYEGIEGKRPELQSPIRLRAEDDDEARARLLGTAQAARDSLRP